MRGYHTPRKLYYILKVEPQYILPISWTGSALIVCTEASQASAQKAHPPYICGKAIEAEGSSSTYLFSSAFSCYLHPSKTFLGVHTNLYDAFLFQIGGWGMILLQA